MGYSILADTLAKNDLIIALYDAQTLSYRKITARQWRDHSLPVGQDLTIYNPDNPYFIALKDSFDSWNTFDVESHLMAKDDLADAVNSTIRIRKRRSIRKCKKYTSRVMREVMKMWKRGYYGKQDIAARKKALELIHQAFRESFVVIRLTLGSLAFECIPKDLKITLQSGDTPFVSSLYEWDESINKYRLCNTRRFAPSDLRHLQFIIAPYIFRVIYRH